MLKRIGILRGGVGENYETSLKKGGAIISYLSENLKDKWKPVDILIDKEGIWHISGLPVQPAELFHKIDVIWNFAHPSLSIILQNLNIPNIGIEGFNLILEYNQKILQENMKQIGFHLPKYFVLNKYNQKYNKIGTMHSLAGFRNQDVYIFPIFPIDNSPIYFTQIEKDRLTLAMQKLHTHLGVKVYLKADFILYNKEVYITDVQFMPNFDNNSPFIKSCDFIGAKTSHILEHILTKY